MTTRLLRTPHPSTGCLTLFVATTIGTGEARGLDYPRKELKVNWVLPQHCWISWFWYFETHWLLVVDSSPLLLFSCSIYKSNWNCLAKDLTGFFIAKCWGKETNAKTIIYLCAYEARGVSAASAFLELWRKIRWNAKFNKCQSMQLLDEREHWQQATTRSMVGVLSVWGPPDIHGKKLKPAKKLPVHLKQYFK